MIIQNSNTYECLLKSFKGEQYNLPVDKIFFLESSWDYTTNDYVKSHMLELQQILDERTDLYHYELVYLSRREISAEFLSLLPQVKEKELALPLLSNAEKFRLYFHGHKEKSMSRHMKMSFVCHIAPNEQSLYSDEHLLYLIDIENIKPSFIEQVFRNFVYQVEDYSRDSLRGKTLLEVNQRRRLVLPGAWKDIMFSIRGRREDSPKEEIREEEKIQFDIEPCSDNDYCLNIDREYHCESESPEVRRKREEEERKREEEAQKRREAELKAAREREKRLREMAQHVKAQIDELQRANGINILSETLGKEMLEQLRLPLDAAPSKLVVDDKYNILLPEYDRKVSMPTLSKTLYFLFLRHPEGFRLVDIDGYKDELRTIYFLLSPRQSIIEANRSIDDLTNIEETDSMRQKLCRLNKAFRDILSEDLASNYMVSGERGEARRIRLLPEQIVLPNSLKF